MYMSHLTWDRDSYSMMRVNSRRKITEMISKNQNLHGLTPITSITSQRYFKYSLENIEKSKDLKIYDSSF